MSVLVLDPKCYEVINNGLTRAAWKRECDEFYASTIRQYFEHKDLEIEGKRLILSWASLNEKSYCVKYNDKESSIGAFINFNAFKPFTAIQLLKYIQCLIYNIEVSTIEQKETVSQQSKDDIKLLEAWQEDLKEAIIGSLPEYKAAKWCEVV